MSWTAWYSSAVRFGTRGGWCRGNGTARAFHPRHAEWNALIGLFPTLAGSRQIFDLAICGSGVPVMTVTDNRGEHELVSFYDAMSTAEQHD